MILNFTIYAIVVILLFVDRQTIKLTEIIGISNGSYYAIFLFVLYLFLLYIDLKPKIKQAANLKLLKRRTLIFSFWVGIIWGVLISLSGGFHYKIDPSVMVFMLLGYTFVGVIFGLFGYLFLRFLTNRHASD